MYCCSNHTRHCCHHQYCCSISQTSPYFPFPSSVIGFQFVISSRSPLEETSLYSFISLNQLCFASSFFLLHNLRFVFFQWARNGWGVMRSIKVAMEGLFFIFQSLLPSEIVQFDEKSFWWSFTIVHFYINSFIRDYIVLWDRSQSGKFTWMVSNWL
jgi:hypothetical protein